MYCPKCNLHSEEYVDKCPLCDGPMEVDEVASGVMKTPPIPDEGGTEELPFEEKMKLDEDPEDQETVALGEEFLDDEAADMKPLDGLEDLDESQSSEPEPELVEPPGEPELPPEIPFEPEETKDSKKPLFIGVLLLLILLAGGGYYYFVLSPQPAKQPIKQEKKVATDKAVEPLQPLVMDEKEVGEDARATVVPEPADVAENTEITPQTEKMSAPPETEPEAEHISPEKTTVAAVSPAEREQIGGLSPEEPLESRTPAEMALADAKKALKAEPLPPASPDGMYLVNVSSFRKEVMADALKDKLGQSGYPASTLMVELPEKGTWYRVVVGGYSNRADAGVVSQRIKAEENLDAWIMKK